MHDQIQLPLNGMLEAMKIAFPRIILLDGGLYLFFSITFILIGYSVIKFHILGVKIQQRYPQKSDYKREILNAFRTIIIFAFLASISLWIQGTEMLNKKYEVNFVYIFFEVVILVCAHDAWFYWTHRMMHLQSFYKKWHRTHHKSITPNPFTTLSFDWREAIVQGLFTFICGIIFAIAPVPSAIFMVIMFWRTIWGHCGIEYHKPGFVDHWFWGIFTTPTHHDLHHSGGFGCNYGLYFVFWDRLMGTEHPDYRKIFREVADRRSLILQHS
jgi:Delta7-sterol 5-desaturase